MSLSKREQPRMTPRFDLKGLLNEMREMVSGTRFAKRSGIHFWECEV